MDKMEDTHLSAHSSDSSMVEIFEKRRRSSSMDILAEAAAVTSNSTYTGPLGHISRASVSWDDAQSVNCLNEENDGTEVNDDVVERSSSLNKRPRGATFSYSPFTSKDPDFCFSPKSSGKFRTLNWIANFHEDEHVTADLLSSLSQFKNQYKSPEAESKSKGFKDLGFGNNKISSITDDLVDGNSNSSSSVLPVRSSDKHDISVLSAVVSKFFNGDCNDENDDDVHGDVYNQRDCDDEEEDYDDDDDDEYYYDDSILNRRVNHLAVGRMRSNSMPELPSSSSASRLRIKATSKDYIIKHGLSQVSSVSRYSSEERKKKIEKFLEKRRNRVWTKKVKYDVRKNFADSRVRVKGRFIRKQQEGEVLSTPDSNK